MLATQILSQVEPQRLLKATEGLVNGAFTITVTRSEDDSLEGFVKNGDNVEYAVAIMPARVFCSCKDSMFRHSVCKHAVALSLHVIRNPQVARKEDREPNLKLGKMRRDWQAAA